MKKRERDNGFEDWGGYMEAKMSKLDDQFSAEAKNFGLKEDNLFNGISIFVNGYTVPPAYELRNLMMKHGGTFHHYHRPDKTTYIVASNLPDSKLKHVNRLTVIKPEWVTDSIKAGRLLNHKDYLLYTNHSKTQPLLHFDKPKAETRSPTKTAKDDKFLAEFYNNSRLHLISTMGATFKQYVNELRSKIKEFPGKELLLNRVKAVDDPEENDKIAGWGSIVMHIDMDCFFVSVSIRQRPDLVGQPVAVTHSKGNKPVARPGVNLQAEYKAYHGSTSSDPNHWSNNASKSYSMAEIASCSYEARKAGVKNGMFMGQALTLCPTLVTLPYDFEGYKDVAKVLYDTVSRYTLNIEAVSCDEMFVDCTELLTSVSMTPLEFASIIRSEIKEKTQCPCSTGFGTNKLQARLATRKAKPNGQYFLEPDMVLDFMSSIPVSDLPGVGRSTTYKLKSMGVTNCSELQKLPLATLKSEFGAKSGETLYNYAYGKDSKSLTFEKVRKSVSAEVNYGIRFQEDSERDKFLKQLSEEVSKRLTEISMKGKSITLKIMVKSKDAPEETAKFLGHGVCDYYTKTNSLKSYTDDPAVIYREVSCILTQFNVPSKDLRGIGIQISKLDSRQGSKNNLNKFFTTKANKTGIDNTNEIKSSTSSGKIGSSVCATTPLASEKLTRINEESEKVNKAEDKCEFNVSESKSDADKIHIHDIDNLKLNEINKEEPQPGTSKMVESAEKTSHSNIRKKRKYVKKSVIREVKTAQPDPYNISISQIDPSFLEALPDELKSEILGAVKKKPVEEPVEKVEVLRNVEGHFSGVDNTTDSVKPSTKDNPASDSLWDQVSPVEMRRLIKEWVDSCDFPQHCDVSMFSNYLTSLVTSRQIDHLHVLLKTFLRQLKRGNKSPEWMASYEATLEEVQNRMLAVYGAKLLQIS